MDTGRHVCTPTCPAGQVVVAMEHLGCWALDVFVDDPNCYDNFFNSNRLLERTHSPSLGLKAAVANNNTALIERGLTEPQFDFMVIAYVVLLERLHHEGPGACRLSGIPHAVAHVGCLQSARPTGRDFGQRRRRRLFGHLRNNLHLYQVGLLQPDDTECINGNDGAALAKRCNKETYKWILLDPVTNTNVDITRTGPAYHSPGDLLLHRPLDRALLAEAYTTGNLSLGCVRMIASSNGKWPLDEESMLSR
ncbi:hypothetical protein VTI74DRAFT_4674 [Chaetomium olivicolor]